VLEVIRQHAERERLDVGEGDLGAHVARFVS
jgi:hypothetical protein